ncbi:HNH endonuclease [Henriciella pelagia]|jgi:putative restriction endonuclease|uniref:Restriction endonuclease n=1 Tax=Henriciella pelagia TaxID=1977912 RepID=A0ABQ1J940_9PROT|nr:HNH endonuclease [Henriciella pelagia]GGB63086.1 restriction endonuclease [Henriciella pelagia]
MARQNWDRREVTLAIELYTRLPFGRLHSGNPEIIALAGQIGRTPSALAMKLVNLASLDEDLDRRGLGNASSLDREVWADFTAHPTQFIERARRIVSEIFYNEAEQSVVLEVAEGKEVERTVKVRQNQRVFREIVLPSYDNQCAVIGKVSPELLTASHIVPWRAREDTRLDPRNGISLNPLHDRAFDRGMISFRDDLSMLVSSKIIVPDHVRSLFNEDIRLKPAKFRPLPEYLAYHRDEVFEVN